MSNISDLKFDDKNFNKHTEYGMSLLEKSLRENGAGRSILIDKDNNIIAGNGSFYVVLYDTSDGAFRISINRPLAVDVERAYTIKQLCGEEEE